jgi:hypothetical protein
LEEGTSVATRDLIGKRGEAIGDAVVLEVEAEAGQLDAAAKESAFVYEE